MIKVTESFLPPMQDYTKFLERIWDSKWMTNRGELVLELEEKLKGYLAVKNIILTNNGTVPLQIALKLFGNGGEIITTPFSYVATTAAIVWENCKPVYVDIHPEYLTIDESKIENAITSKTTAILATHVYGNPCCLESIESIAKKHNLKVIYDAAHAFGVEYKGNSIFNYGDISTCSFHATKLFHTAEGGAMFSKTKELHNKLFYSHNFGHNGPLEYHGLGINGKMSELQAAMGLSVLPYLEKIINERKKIVCFYDENLNFSTINKIEIRKDVNWNYSYYPIIFENEKILLQVETALLKNNIFPRRYFFPSLNRIPYTNGTKMIVSESISAKILCLPLYVGLSEKDLNKIINVVNTNLC